MNVFILGSFIFIYLFLFYRIEKSGIIIMVESPGKFLQIPDYWTRHFVCILLPIKRACRNKMLFLNKWKQFLRGLL